MKKKNQKISLDDALNLFQSNDELAVPLATGQPMGLMNKLSEKQDWEKLELFCGLLTFPYPILNSEKVHVTSGYYGPLERFLNDQGSHMNYLPASFTGFETYAHKKKFRVTATTLSAPDQDGFLTFGTHPGAIYNPFLESCRDENRITIAEVNLQMPVVYGREEFGDNKIHMNDLDYYYETDQRPMDPPAIEITDVERKIAENVLSLISSGDTLQLGIGGVPNHVASSLAVSSLSDFGIHSELISDGFLKLWESGKISNRDKGVFEGQSVFTFAFGSQALYDFLDERKGKNQRRALALPVSIVNDPHWIAKNKRMISINSGLMIDFSGQVCSEAIGLRQYSGVGGQLSFVQGAYDSPEGKTILCIKSTATVNGQKISNILPTLPQGSLISTPRHYVEYVVTEYGIANLYGVSDEERGKKLMAIAHPDFRAELQEAYEKIKKEYYKN